MPGFNYGSGTGDGTNWSSERGNEPEPGGGNGRGTSGGNSSNNSITTTLKPGDSITTPLGKIVINSEGKPTMNGIILTPDNSSLVMVESGHFARILNSLVEKPRTTMTKKHTEKEKAVSSYSVKYVGDMESIQYGIIPSDYILQNGKIGQFAPCYEDRRRGHGDYYTIYKGMQFKENPDLTAAFNLGKLQLSDALKFANDFYLELSEKLSKVAGKYATDLAKEVNGKKIRNIDEALSAFNKYKNSSGKKFSTKDRTAIANALNSVHYEQLAVKLAKFSKAFKYTGGLMDAYETYKALIMALKTDDWRPFFVKIETLVAGKAASGVAAFLMASITGISIGIIGFAFIMAIVGALVNDSMINSVNSRLGL